MKDPVCELVAAARAANHQAVAAIKAKQWFKAMDYLNDRDWFMYMARP